MEPSAASKVFEVVELLEHILNNLECHQLFAMQRVNHSFRNVIRGSKQLQRLMFLAPPVTDPCINAEMNPIAKRLPIFRHFACSILSVGHHENDRTHLEFETSESFEVLLADFASIDTTSGPQASWRTTLTLGCSCEIRAWIWMKSLNSLYCDDLDSVSTLGEQFDLLGCAIRDEIELREKKMKEARRNWGMVTGARNDAKKLI